MDDRVSKPFIDTCDALARYHPCYKNDINLGFWYFDTLPLREDNRGKKNGLDLMSLDIQLDDENVNDAGYWVPPEPLRHNIVQRSLDEIGRLREIPDHKINPDFFKFHSRFSDKLSNREINDTVRISYFDGKILKIQKATYLDQVGTNITADSAIDTEDVAFQGTPRSIDSNRDGSIKTFEKCICANTIGVCGLFLDKDLNIISALRNFNPDSKRDDDVTKRLGAMEKGWHCFSSGVLKWQDVANNDSDLRKSFVDGLRRGLQREIKEETGILAEEGIYTIVPYAFAREIKRPGKPQFFFAIHFPNHSAKEIFNLVNRNINAGNVEELDEFGTRNIFLLGKKRKMRILGHKIDDFNNINLVSLAREVYKDFTFTYELFGSIYLYTKYEDLKNENI